MPKAKHVRLSFYHKNLIEDNYKKVHKSLSIRLNQKYGFCKIQQDNLVERAISYMVDVTPQFNPNCGRSYINYCVDRCLFKLIDEYRSKRYAKSFEKERNDIREQLYKERGYVNDEDVIEVLKTKHNNKTVNKVMNTHVFNTIDFGVINNEETPAFADNDDAMEKIEWRDSKRKIIHRAKEQFSDVNNKCYYTLIKDYLLPKADNLQHKTLQGLAKKVGLSVGRLSQMTRDDTMQMFFAA